jgi:NADH-quinone oxidoreductase subunit F
MSLPILAAARDWPSILLARASELESDPADIARAEGLGAWKAYRDAVSDLSPDAIIRIVSESGLRGRGGGGFPAGRKWRDTATATERRRVVVANGFARQP